MLPTQTYKALSLQLSSVETLETELRYLTKLLMRLTNDTISPLEVDVVSSYILYSIFVYTPSLFYRPVIQKCSDNN